MADPSPANMLGAKFSIPYAVAAHLVLGHTGVAAFQEHALGDPRIRALAQRVEMSADSEMSPRAADRLTARVRLSLRDGRVLEETTAIVRGDAANPVPPEEVLEKFRTLSSPILGEPRTRKVAELTYELETLKDVRDLTMYLAPA
jgi:2-methylcitrate dehydratase PrpD